MKMDGFSSTSMSEAARTGNLSVLKKCSRRDTNKRDNDGMTPVHWTASYGNIEALRILIGKGGNPDKPNNEGCSSLHLSAAAGQLHCLVFLTNFGGNVYAISDNGTTPIQEAANKGHLDCVRHLEALITHQVEQDRFNVDKMQQKSKKDAEKRVKEKTKLLQKLDRDYEKQASKQRRIGAAVSHFNGQRILTHEREYGYQQSIDHTKKLKYSQLTGVPRSDRESFDNESPISNNDDDSNSTGSFRRIEEEYLTRSLLTDDITFERQNGFNNNDKLSDTTDHTSSSKNSRLTSSTMASSLRSVNTSNGFIQNGIGIQGHLGPMITLRNGQIVEINPNTNGSLTAGQLLRGSTVTYIGGPNQSASQPNESVSVSASMEIHMSPLYTFLHALQLDEYRGLFLREKIDLRACLLCDEDDLREIGLPLGPRKKIADAIKQRKKIMDASDVMHDSAV